MSSSNSGELTVCLDDVADLLALPGDYAQARRRITRALERLEERGFIDVRSLRRGRRRLVLFCEDRALAWTDVELPRELYRLPQPVSPLPPSDQFIVLGSGLWTNGWTGVLAGDATVALLSLRYLQATRQVGGDTRLFLTETLRDRRFGFSEDTWYSGRAALASLGLASLSGDRVRGAGSQLIARKVVRLNSWATREQPESVANTTP
jgi:hypothetical protein